MEIKDFGIYTIDKEYVRKLNEADSEVYFDEYTYDRKPYAGIMIFTGKYNYFIPLTSAKKKHADWNLISKDMYIIYETMPDKKVRPNWVYRNNNDGTVKHILSILEIKKMIPVPDGLFKRIVFSDLDDKGYAMLLMKEYYFLKPYADDILEKAYNIYETQKETGKINRFTCNYQFLEKICDTYETAENSNNDEENESETVTV